MTREELLSRTRSLLWAAWQTSGDDIASVAADTLIGLGMLVPEGGAAELERLRQLVDASPAELSEEQIDALADAGDRALNDYYHERACACALWPESCHTDPAYAKGFWDTGAFAIGMAAVIGLWESLRTEAESRELRRLRARVADAVATVARLEQKRVELERIANAERARVAELEAERQSTNAALFELTVALQETEGQAPCQVVPVVDDVPVPVVLTEQDGPAVVTAAAMAAAAKLALPAPDGGERP
ncbi:hypothetical protein [Streptomyces sp. NPDC005322]|uniref:hypothetical protein n=1 Tax=Streptomyces sp. NPDC005322 TaxID=3157032 RepID=UPI0033A0291D